MNSKIIRDAIHRSLTGSIAFPQVISMLLAEGIESYHVDLVRAENRYYDAQGESLVEPVALDHPQAATLFSAEHVAAAVKRSQTGQINYQQFISQILDAGAVYYIVYLTGKKVVYLGREGHAHTEHFPKPV